MKNRLLNSGVITAIAASLCCITPVLALIAGTTGIASLFSWIAPFRPYLIGLTILILGIAWYQKLRPIHEADCDCENDPKPKFSQSRTFLGIVTLFALILLAFPYYSSIFYSATGEEIEIVKASGMTIVDLKISGMTCVSCEEHVNNEVKKIKGVIDAKSSYKNGNTIITYDSTHTNENEIAKAINATNYSVASEHYSNGN